MTSDEARKQRGLGGHRTIRFLSGLIVLVFLIGLPETTLAGPSGSRGRKGNSANNQGEKQMRPQRAAKNSVRKTKPKTLLLVLQRRLSNSKTTVRRFVVPKSALRSSVSKIKKRLSALVEGAVSSAYKTRGKRILVLHHGKLRDTADNFSKDTFFHAEVQDKFAAAGQEPVFARLDAMIESGGLVIGRLVEEAPGEPLVLIKYNLTVNQRQEVLRLLEKQLTALRKAGAYHGDLIGGSNVNVEIVKGEVRRVLMYDPGKQPSVEEGQAVDRTAVDDLRRFFADPEAETARREGFLKDIEGRYADGLDPIE